MGYISNSEQLLGHGNKLARQKALQIIELALSRADPYAAVKKLVALHNNVLSVGQLTFDLEKAGKIYIIGAGKATFAIARGLEEILGNRIDKGIVICKYGEKGSLQKVQKRLAQHPVPDRAGLAAAQEILSLANETQPRDIVLAAFTGGSSALMPYPPKGITLEDKKQVTQLLLHSGANIVEINSVRKHLSLIKGGRLARAIHPKAQLVNLTVSDVIGDPLDYITCPTVPDTSTIFDAQEALSKYGLWEKVPRSVFEYLKDAGSEKESPKDLSGHCYHNFILVPGDAACEGAARAARQMGLSVMVLSTMLEGESCQVGGTFADIAREITANKRPVAPPCAVIGGGETTVHITGESGEGGPNQEFAVGAALRLSNLQNVAVAGLDTDGTDGPTGFAGAIIDEYTLNRAKDAGINLHTALRQHNIAPALAQLGDTLITGNTGTNVNDLKLMIILPE